MIRNRISTDVKRRGFSLVEFAIVLGVVAIIVGGIWYFANQAYESTRREQALEMVTAIVTNMRAASNSAIGLTYNNTASSINNTQDPTYTSNLILLGIIPDYLIRREGTGAGTCSNVLAAHSSFETQTNLCADTPWGYSGVTQQDTKKTKNTGSLHVCWSTTAGGCQAPAAAGVVSQYFNVRLMDIGYSACIYLGLKLSSASGPPGLYSVEISYPGVGTINQRFPPLTAANVNGDCSATGSNQLDFTYVLHLPST